MSQIRLKAIPIRNSAVSPFEPSHEHIWVAIFLFTCHAKFNAFKHAPDLASCCFLAFICNFGYSRWIQTPECNLFQNELALRASWQKIKILRWVCTRNYITKFWMLSSIQFGSKYIFQYFESVLMNTFQVDTLYAKYVSVNVVHSWNTR